MEISPENIHRLTNGLQEVPENWCTATGPRTLCGHADPCQLWLKFHGAAHGFTEDPTDYSFLEFISGKGVEFETAWMDHYAPDAVRARSDDRDVAKVQTFMRTIDLIGRDTDVISYATLWSGDNGRLYIR